MNLAIKCSELARLASEGRDRGLNWRERLSVAVHLLFCQPCLRLRRQLDFLGKAAKSAGAGEAPIAGARLDDGARERIRRSLQRRGS
ncbi:MAG: zf-HC2 domain-containing protein [Gammaproteobacteria bacterium]|nr:zf-HC2 domain-containing protein [Gammaproteobacteria bacterium]